MTRWFSRQRGKFSLHGADALLLPISVFTDMFVWLSENSRGGCCWIHAPFFCKLHGASVPYLENHVCLWVLLCLPAFMGHLGTPFQEAPGTGEWHCHRWQQYLRNFAAFPSKDSD